LAIELACRVAPAARLGNVKQDELVRVLAREARVPEAATQDRIDALVHRIVIKLRRGQPVDLPGLGKLVRRATGQKKH
jgi:nucleoid DNA-binding protein